jgi:hypothetical protein
MKGNDVMTANFDRGVLNQSSWHGLEEVGVFTDAASMIEHGERTGAWPVGVWLTDLVTKFAPQFASGKSSTCDTIEIEAPGKAVVATYREHEPRCLATVGDRYAPTSPDDWRELVQAAVSAGAKPTGAFSLQGGTKVLATFEINDDEATGLRTYLLLADSFDGSTKLICGTTTIRVVCCNTLNIALRKDGANAAQLKHTASLSSKIGYLKRAIKDGVKSGQSMAELYETCRNTPLHGRVFDAVFDKLFPPPDDDDSVAKQTRAHNRRAEAMSALNREENRDTASLGEDNYNAADLLNTATWLVDRDSTGKHKRGKGGSDPLNSLLFGSRANRLQEIQHTIEVMLTDGTIEQMTAAEAQAAGCDERSVGRAILAEMLS